MSKILAACVAATIVTAILAGTAQAAPTEVNVRIEGRSETLFEGPVAAEPHGVRASSDTLEAGRLRRCDGINANDPGNTVPGVTPTAVSADAMTLVGQTFDGRWYRQYEDYFVNRFGPDAANPATEADWGLLVDNAFTNVGGCQYQLDAGDEVLWVYDAFKNRPTLALFPASAAYTTGPRPLTVRGVAPGEPVPLEVASYADDLEGSPPSGPSRSGSTAFPGARVSPVVTSAAGSQRVETLLGTTSDAGGDAAVSYTEPGWHRVKATVGAPGSESAIRSNRIDICVEGVGGATLEGASSCAELPAADRVRTAAPTGGAVEGAEPAPSSATPATPAPTPGSRQSPATPSAAGPTAGGALRLSTPRVDRRLLGKGRLTVSWTVIDAGPGVRRWTISSRSIGRKGAGWVTRASGSVRSKATVRLPRGGAFRLRFAVTDVRGTTSTVALGKVSVPARRTGRAHR